MSAATITASQGHAARPWLAAVPLFIGKWTIRIVLTALIVTFAAVALGPMTGKYQLVSVLTGSMDPTSPAGSVVYETPVSPQDLKVGDVITYQAPIGDQPVITHRITKIDTDDAGQQMINTKGDANPAADPWDAVLSGGTVWRVQATVPFMGTVIQLLRTPQAHVLTMSIVPLILLLTLLRSIWRRDDSDDADLTDTHPTLESADSSGRSSELVKS